MKATLYALFTALLVVGCGSPNVDDTETLDKILAEAVEEDKLQKRGKEGEQLFYATNEQTPFTGWVKRMYDDGQVRNLAQAKDGKKDGLLITWYENGQKWEEGSLKNGKFNGLVTVWYENGQKMNESNFKDDKPDGLMTLWYENGQRRNESNFKDGLLMSSKSWQPNGDKCPVTNVVNGNGTTVGYKNDGTVKIRTTFKNGKKVVLASSESTNHILKISTTGNVDKLIICDKGKTPNVFHEFDFLMEGWSKEILFQESFRCYSSSIENIVFSVDDGPLKKVGGGKIGRGTFNWKRE